MPAYVAARCVVWREERSGGDNNTTGQLSMATQGPVGKSTQAIQHTMLQRLRTLHDQGPVISGDNLQHHHDGTPEVV